jgi:hypothetical protein
VFEAADDEVHIFVDLPALDSGRVQLTETLQKEDIYMARSVTVAFLTTIINNFEKLFGLILSECLLRDVLWGRNELQLVGLSNYLRCLGSLHSTFCQVARLIVKQAMWITTPGDSLHKHPIFILVRTQSDDQSVIKCKGYWKVSRSLTYETWKYTSLAPS